MTPILQPWKNEYCEASDNGRDLTLEIERPQKVDDADAEVEFSLLRNLTLHEKQYQPSMTISSMVVELPKTVKKDLGMNRTKITDISSL